MNGYSVKLLEESITVYTGSNLSILHHEIKNENGKINGNEVIWVGGGVHPITGLTQR